jgi:hypothetical protein
LLMNLYKKLLTKMDTALYSINSKFTKTNSKAPAM